MRTDMAAPGRKRTAKAVVVCEQSVMSGEPVVQGTRVKASTILAYLRGGYSAQEIFEDYPSLPVDGIEAVEAWAESTFGHDWLIRTLPIR